MKNKLISRKQQEIRNAHSIELEMEMIQNEKRVQLKCKVLSLCGKILLERKWKSIFKKKLFNILNFNFTIN